MKVQQRGFSLIEVMISGVLFLVTLTGVLVAFHTTTALSSHFEDNTAGVHIAEGVMEELILKTRGDAELADGITVTKTYDTLGVPLVGGRFTARWTVVANTPIAGMKQINLDVTWLEETVTHKVSLMTWRE